MLGTEIITRRTNNPRWLRLEMVRSLLCNFVRTTGTNETCERKQSTSQAEGV
jgi:hypothetical protein